MKKILIPLILGMFLISFTSALELEKVGSDWDNVGQFTKDITTSKWGKYEIRNSVLKIPFLQLSKVADIELTNNSDYCGEGCFAIIPITLHDDGILVDEVTFETKQEDGSWIYQPIRNYQFSYEGIIQDYETVCNNIGNYTNGTYIESCSQQQSGTHIGRINYKEGSIVAAGTYLLRLDGTKKSSRTVDWKIKTNGIWTNEWAVWGNISEGDDAEVILNSPEDNNISFTGDVEFSCSSNVTGGATLTNISLYTNQSGTWEAKNITNISTISSQGLFSYYTLDETTGTIAFDTLGLNNLTNNGATINQTGKIDRAYVFADTTNLKNSTTITLPIGASNRTTCSWVYPTTASDDYLWSYGVETLRAFWSIAYLSGTQFDIVVNGDDLIGSGTHPINNWYHVCATYNGTTTSLFVNGINEGNKTQTLNTVQTDLFIGTHIDGDKGLFGTQDEIGMWNVTLNSTEILALYNSGFGVRPGFGTTDVTQTWDRTITESTLWNCKSCDTDGDCGFAEQNRTVLLDIDAPTIEVESPNGTLDYNYIGNNETLNVTFTDLNLDSCWYNYNGTNVTINGCISGVKNSTNFTLQEGNFNITVYTNDSLGNINSSFVEWSYLVFENSQTYPSISVESATETYVANIKYNSTEFGVITGILYLNGTQYIGTRTGSGDSAIFTTSATMPSVDAETKIESNWVIGLTNESGITVINLTSNNVTVGIINLSICDATNNVPFWNFTILNETNFVELNSTFEATFAVRSVGSTEDNQFSFTDTNGNKSQYDFCISPGTENYTVDASVKLTKSGFVDKFYNYQEVSLSNSTREDNLYMMTLTDSTSFIVHVVYVDSTDVIGAEVRVQRYYQGTGQWVTTEILTTNYDGEAVGHLLAEDADYRFLVYQSGALIHQSSPTQITCAVTPCTVTLTIPITVATGTETLENLESTLIYSSTTNIFTYTYSDTSGDFDSARLEVVRLFPSNSTLIIPCNETKLTFSGVITCDITGQVNGTYQASGYIIRAGFQTLTDRINGVLGNQIYNQMGLDGVLWSFFVLIGIIMLGVYRPSMAIIFGTIGLIFLGLLQIIKIGAISIIAISAIAIILLMRVGRE